MKKYQEIILKGVPINGGISIGSLFILNENNAPSCSEHAIRENEVVHEVKRFRRAIDFCKIDLKSLQCSLAKEGSKEAVQIIDTHIQMLDDPQMKEVVEKNISSSKKNTESVFQNVISDYIGRFKGNSPIEKQTRIDLKDLSHRILKKLHPQQRDSADFYPSNSIVFAKELIPSQVAEAPASKVLGFVTQNGALTSHVSLISRSKGICYISGIDESKICQYHGQSVIVDANKGLLILNPSQESLEKYYRLQQEHRQIFSYAFLDEKKCVTKDGVDIQIHSNIDTMQDLDHLDEFKIEKIGLLRSEFLFLTNEKLAFDANHQYKLYKKLFGKTGDRPVNFRLFDIGADKLFFSWQSVEANPALGVRSMRFLLDHREILVSQLKALLKANVRNKLSILLPLVRDFNELEEFKEILNATLFELQKHSSSTIHRPLVGCMVEVPSFALMADLYAKECDFLSIGSNDLTQYTLAIDRDNQQLQNNYQPIHPSVLHLIKNVKKACQRENCALSICGQMASNPLMIPLIVGLGIYTISCSLRSIPLIKNTIASIDAKEAKALVDKALKAKSSQEILDLLISTY